MNKDLPKFPLDLVGRLRTDLHVKASITFTAKTNITPVGQEGAWLYFFSHDFDVGLRRTVNQITGELCYPKDVKRLHEVGLQVHGLGGNGGNR